MGRWPQRLWAWLRAAPGRFWRWARAPANRRELWGYVVWGTMGIVVAIPELIAAVASKHVPFPTISGTLGYIEYWHPEAALAVVAVLVWSTFHAVRISSPAIKRLDEPVAPAAAPEPTAAPAQTVLANPEKQLVRLPGGRLSTAEEVRPVPTLPYFLFALAAVAIVFAVVRGARPDDKYLLGEALYAAIALLWIVIPGLLAYRFGRYVRYPTLFRTIQLLEEHVRPLAIVFAAGILILLVHLAFYPWPASIPDIQDLHKQYAKQRHEQKKQKEPSAYAP